MAYDVGVRSYLQGQGVSPSDIGYDSNSGNVTIRGQNFYKPELNLSGTTYSNQQNLDNAYKTYKSSLPTIQSDGTSTTGASTTTGTGTTGVTGNPTNTTGTKPPVTGSNSGGNTSTYVNPLTQQIADIMKQMGDARTSMQQPVDAYGTPQYAAAQAQQAKASQQSTRAAQESMGQSGFGRSTNLADRAQQIQNDANDYLTTQIVPQIQSQLQAQKQQQYQDLQNQFNNLYQLSTQADTQHQNEINQANNDRTFNAGRQDAATNATGYYNPSGMTLDQINQEIAKNSAAYGTATPEQQVELHNRNLELNGLLGKTYDPNTGTYSGGNGQVGYRTLAGQTLDLNNAKDMATLTGYMSDGKGGYIPTNAKQQQDLSNAWLESEQLGAVTQNLSRLTGIPTGTETQAAKNQAAQIAISARNATNSEKSTQASIDNMNADNTRQDNAVKLTAEQKKYSGDVMGELAKAESEKDPVKKEALIRSFLNQNAGDITNNLGADAYQKIHDNALAEFTKVTPVAKQDLTVREKAIAAAQADTLRWNAKGADRNALIKEYEKYYTMN